MENGQPVSNQSVYYLKLGGSLITDKQRPETPRLDVISRLAHEIASALSACPNLQLVLGHGSGSFGHSAGSRHGTRQGVRTAEDWRGFAEVWYAANRLNRLVVDALVEEGLPVVALSPCAMVTSKARRVLRWDTAPIQAALAAGLLPLIQGDVVFDTAIGGTILSTEDLFAHLAGGLPPQRILLAGIEAGVWADYPACTRLQDEITNREGWQGGLHGSAAPDVTGGMAAKVRQSLEMIAAQPHIQIFIFSGEAPGAVESALLGEKMGTWLHA